jgi:hypothetical protein
MWAESLLHPTVSINLHLPAASRIAVLRKGARAHGMPLLITGTGDRKCALSGDVCFSRAHPCELAEDGLIYRVKCSVDAGLNMLALDDTFSMSEDPNLPPSTIDVVRWAGLRQIKLDKSGFIKHWQRYLAVLQQHMEKDGSSSSAARSDDFLLRAHLYARKLLPRFDELDVFVGASDDVQSVLAILHYSDDDPLTPYLDFLVDGLVECEDEQQAVPQ